MTIKDFNDLISQQQTNFTPLPYISIFNDLTFKVIPFTNAERLEFIKGLEIIKEADEVDVLAKRYQYICDYINKFIVDEKGNNVDVLQLHYFNFIELMLFLTSISSSSSMEYTYNCNNEVQLGNETVPCNTTIDFVHRLNELKILNKDKINNTKYVDILVNESKVRLHFSVTTLVNLIEDVNDVIAIEDIESGMMLVDNRVQNKSQEEKIKAFLDILTDAQIEEISKAMKDVPVLSWETKFTCPSCGKEHNLIYNNSDLEFFFM